MNFILISFCELSIILIVVNAKQFSDELGDDQNIGWFRTRRNSRTNKKDQFGYDFIQHNNYSEIVRYLKTVAHKYNKIAKLKIVGKTYEKRKIYALHISRKSKSKAKKKVIIIECGVHAREWTPIETCMYTIKMILYGGNTRTTQSKLLKKYHLIFLPVVNPDGYVYSLRHDKMWRKNRSPAAKHKNKTCRGVDLNRNFDWKFCVNGHMKVSKDPCSEFFCGKKPFSEKETQAVRKVILKHRKHLLAYISMHSYGMTWMTPFAYTYILPKHYRELARVAFRGMNGVKKVRDTKMGVGPMNLLLYPSSGTSIDYAYIRGKAKYGFHLEIGKTFSTDSRKELFFTMREIYKGLVAAMMAMVP